jgi:gamma-glutamyltranspeptidase/glutathione hydrolase
MRLTPSRIALALVLAATGPGAAQGLAEPAPIQSDDARLLPVLGAHGMVASQEARATRVGVEILKAGGNAVDAAVAVGFALAVTLPRAGNLGGGGFMMIHRAAGDETVALDYRETAPAAARSDMFLDPNGDPDRAASTRTGKAVGVPGTVRGLAEAHSLYGSGRFTLADLIAPAEKLARDGIPVPPACSAAGPLREKSSLPVKGRWSAARGWSRPTSPIPSRPSRNPGPMPSIRA